MPEILSGADGMVQALCTEYIDRAPSLYLLDPTTLLPVARRHLSDGSLLGGVYGDGVRTVWRQAYDRGEARKPGQLSHGSGSTPTFFGDRTGAEFVVITDNASPRENLLVYRARDGREVCRLPILTEEREQRHRELPRRLGELGLHRQHLRLPLPGAGDRGRGRVRPGEGRLRRRHGAHRCRRALRHL